MSRQSAGRVLAGLALLLQALAVLAAAAAGRLPAPQWPTAAGLAALAALGGVAVWWRGAPAARRAALALLALAQVTLVPLFWSSRPRLGDAAAWGESQRAALAARASALAGSAQGLGAGLDSLCAAAARRAPADDPFALARATAAAWDEPAAATGAWPLSAVVWSGTERVGWSAGAQPLPPAAGEAPPGDLRWGRIEAGRESWFWRRFSRVPADDGGALLLELQLRLAPLDGAARAAAPLGAAAEAFAARLEPGGTDQPARVSGDAGSGLAASLAVALPDRGPDGAAWRLRIEVTAPGRAAAAHAPAAQRLVAILAAWAIALVAWGAAAAGAAGALACAWAARLLCARVDLLRWVQPGFPRDALPAAPGGLSSLLDPAYFATPALGGLLASAADAVVTASLLAITVAALLRRATPPGPGRTAWPVFVRGAAWGVAAAAALLAARWFALTFAENANPRLIGPRVPYRFLSFWALHLALLFATGALVALAHRLASRLGRAAGALAGAALGAIALAAAAPGLALTARMALGAGTLLLLAGGAFVRPAQPAARRLALVVPALIVVLWNYGSLAEAYRHAETAWLERKAAEIVAPQQEWLSFLLGDALEGMADADAREREDWAAVSPASAGLWRDWPAYDLWRRSAVRDIGLPCLVEVLDADGFAESLFAFGFFRDFGYEVGERSAWSALGSREAMPAAATVRAQSERRRYPAGDEWVLRGEIAREARRGWIRLELPAQSRRIGTLLARLTGQPAALPAQAYLPRAEVDRDVLLVRGDDGGWLDAGPGAFPDEAADAAVARLKTGRAARAVVRAGGAAYRCVWRAVPAARASSPGEGFLVGLEVPGAGDRLLDVSRLCLLDLVLAAAVALPWLAARLLRRGRPLALGFQERFFAAYLVLGLLPLLLAGTFIDRLTVQGLAAAARAQARDGLDAAVSQLQGLLAEQARALAGSEYIADLLASRLAGQRPVGPFAARQAIVFGGDGRLLLDETLSDLDEGEAARLLETARAHPLVLMETEGNLTLGLVIPVDLSDLLPEMVPGGEAAATPPQPRERQAGGWFFYRQRVDGDLMAGLADIIQGEVALSEDGEIVVASHPERVFSGARPPLMAPETARRLARWPGTPDVAAAPGTRLSFTASAALPALSLGEAGGLRRRALPAALSVTFPARDRDLALQRERTVLSLAGLATLIFLTAAALGLALAWRIFGPVRVLVGATRRLAGGDFAAPLPEEGRDEVGLLSAAFRAMRDDLARAQRELASRERFLATILERVPVGVAVFRGDGGVAIVNPAAAEILAAGGDDGGRPSQAVAALRDGFSACLAGAAEGEAELRRGRRTLRGRLAPLHSGAGGGDTVLVFEDVTEFLDTKRLALNAELARQVAHEIKNPLTPIQLSIQFLEQAYRDRAPYLDDIVRDTVRQVLGQVSLLRQIATEFSLLGKPGALPVAPVDLPSLVMRVTDRYRSAGDAAAPRIHVAPGPVPAALADAESLEKVLGNLMENSLQAVDEPARLELTVTFETGAREVTLLWADNGPGLAPDVAERLFELYFSTKTQGTGLGLAICRSLLERMGGRIALANRADGAGAVAAVTLLRAEPGAAPGEGVTRGT